ncbi:hypothetical protein HOM13_01885 [Candidatus Woesearchaeota archaeon]|mgnify:CR=1 FL=1|jgi:hypothetical protein|nr:hypothetical protein [Candidatus Woesearchaeota archaeon]MBT5215463.1 hypothetical protein [Candidatus Woesearchaeota archaeon]
MTTVGLKGKITKLLKSKGICVCVTKAGNYHEVNKEILRQISKNKTIYVSLNKSCENVVKDLKKDKISDKNFLFIDAKGKNYKEGNFISIADPCALTQMSIAITTAANTGGFGSLFLDTLNTLLIYNDMKTSEKFTQYILNKLKSLNMDAVVMSIEEDKAKEIIALIAQISDELVSI